MAEGNVDRGIVLGGSGNGEAMVANRIPRVRCAVCWSRETAVLARSHHDANMLSLGARTISLEQALGIVEAWLTTPFEGGRHLRRIALMDEEESVSGTPQGKEGPFRGPGAAGSALKEGNDASAQAPVPYDILISFRYIKYLEGKNAIEFQVDPGLKTPSIVHIPSEERWRAELQSWARDRREEILDRVKIKCSHMNCEWREY